MPHGLSAQQPTRKIGRHCGDYKIFSTLKSVYGTLGRAQSGDSTNDSRYRARPPLKILV